MNPEDFLKKVLESIEFKVQKIQTKNTRTPDFLVTDNDGEKYLIELKTKYDDPVYLEERNEVLNRGEIFEDHTPIKRGNRISGIIKDAAKQLSEFKDEKVDYRIVCLFAQGLHQDVQMELFESSLYGIRQIVDFENKDGTRLCYFFDNSDFFNNKEVIDAALLTTNQQAKLCVNPLSSSYPQITESLLYKLLGKGVCDPIVEEKKELAT